jgi:protein-S-isoprenylcysteine O-methyltransferase Ste14
MTRVRAAAGSLLFLFVAPGVMGGLVPYAITGWDPAGPPLILQLVGIALIAAGSAVLLAAFARFVIEGVGTPAPVAPTEHLVVGGLYRYVRNPQYLAVSSVILGQALLLGRPGLLLWLAVFAATVTAFVHGYEEPTLLERYGAEYDAYRREVPRWRPRGRARASRERGLPGSRGEPRPPR